MEMNVMPKRKFGHANLDGFLRIASSDDEEIKFKDKLKSFFNQINVEPVIFLYQICFTLYSNSYMAFFQYKECVDRLRRNNYAEAKDIHSFCMSLGGRTNGNETNREFDQVAFLNDVQSSVALYTIGYETVNTIPAVLAALFMGSWCDSHGRKPIILISTAGMTISLALVIAVSSLDSLPLSTMTIVAFMKSATGRGVTSHLAAFAMISDMTTTNTMFTIRVGIASGAISLGGLMGSLLSAAILWRWDNFSYIFLISSLFSTIAFFYTAFFVAETYKWARRRRISLVQAPDMNSDYDNEPTDAYYDYQVTIGHRENRSNVLLGMLIDMRETIRVLIRNRLGHRRLHLCLGLISLLIIDATDSGGLRNLFVKRPPLSFTDSEYSILAAMITLCQTMTGMLVASIMKWFLGISDISLILMGVIMAILGKCMFAFSVEAAAITGMQSMYVVGFRSFLPSLVHRAEAGRLFAAIASVESCIAPLLCTYIMNDIYAATVQWFPGFAFLIGALIASTMFALMSFVKIHNQIIDGSLVKWSDDYRELRKRRISVYEDL